MIGDEPHELRRLAETYRGRAQCENDPVIARVLHEIADDLHAEADNRAGTKE